MSGLYVGYRALPARERSFLRLWVPALLWLLCAIAAGVGWTLSQTWGAGRWADTVVTLEGVLTMDPYPVVTTEAGAVFTVESGKLGARAEMEKLSGARVQITGAVLTRDGIRMMELLPGDAGVRVIGEAEGDVEAGTGIGTVGLLGEVVDFKCWLGAMRPGRGVPHKSCAALCVRSGIPPALVTPDGRVYVLTGPEGEAFNEEASQFVGRRVALSGELIERDGVRLVRIVSLRVKR